MSRYGFLTENVDMCAVGSYANRHLKYACDRLTSSWSIKDEEREKRNERFGSMKCEISSY